MKEKQFAKFLKKTCIFSAVVVALMTLVLTTKPEAAAKFQITDISISDAVEDELLIDSAVPSYGISINTIDGIVTLSGSVNNIMAKERAARIAATVKGVRGVVNKIKVDPSILRTDREIRDDVNDALLLDPATDSYEIDVKVENNVVTLSGDVDSWQEKELCETVAKGVRGVIEVNNDILVKWKTERPDHEIRPEVEKALNWDAFVDNTLIDVKVKD